MIKGKKGEEFNRSEVMCLKIVLSYAQAHYLTCYCKDLCTCKYDSTRYFYVSMCNSTVHLASTEHFGNNTLQVKRKCFKHFLG